MKISHWLTEKNDSKALKSYLLPKIHTEGNPGCPVVRSVNCHTANVSKYVDYHLQQINHPKRQRHTRFLDNVRESKNYT